MTRFYPGIARRMAEQILTEIGTDVKNHFPTAAHLCSWAALFPGLNESTGKKKSSKCKKGDKYLRSALTEAAQSVRGSKNYLGALYRRTFGRKGRKRAAIVVAHAILRNRIEKKCKLKSTLVCKHRVDYSFC